MRNGDDLDFDQGTGHGIGSYLSVHEGPRRPIDLTLVDTALMTCAEVDWLDNYHAHVLDEVGSRLKEPDREWLINATRAVKKRR